MPHPMTMQQPYNNTDHQARNNHTYTSLRKKTRHRMRADCNLYFTTPRPCMAIITLREGWPLFLPPVSTLSPPVEEPALFRLQEPSQEPDLPARSCSLYYCSLALQSVTAANSSAATDPECAVVGSEDLHSASLFASSAVRTVWPVGPNRPDRGRLRQAVDLLPRLFLDPKSLDGAWGPE